MNTKFKDLVDNLLEDFEDYQKDLALSNDLYIENLLKELDLGDENE